MALFSLIVLISTLVAGILAQLEIPSERVWGAVAFINNGERTPLTGPLNTVLTPEGAQQMLNQGTAFRARYLRGRVNGTEWKDFEKAYIQHMNMDAIYNSDMDIISQTDEWFTAGALAFMQGLYPPVTHAWDDATGFRDVAQNFVENENDTSYPLQGYQYPNLNTWGIADPHSTAIQGKTGCSAWLSEMRYNLTDDLYLKNLYESTYDFYQGLFNSAPLAGTMRLEAANFWNAYAIYDYVNYMYSHNETVYKNLKNSNITLGRLRGYANDLERASHTNANGNGNSDRLNVLYTISGRTLAERIAQQLLSNVQWKANREKLTLMFGSFEPIMSFLSVSGLLTPRAITAGPLHGIPKPGAAMVFELYGNDSTNSDLQPSEDNLRVRFYYRETADLDEKFVPYGIFNSAKDGTGMAFTDFVRAMQQVGTSPYEWCDICGPTSAPWCAGRDSLNSGSVSGRDGIDSAIAGIIGAAVMLGLIFIALLILFTLCNFRLTRKPNSNNGDNPEAVTSITGGFKGPEKKDGDPDVTVTRAGVHHERVGSWELKEGTTLPIFAGISKDSPREGRPSMDDDGISVMGATPVKPHESI